MSAGRAVENGSRKTFPGAETDFAAYAAELATELFRYFLRRLNSPDDAADAVADCMLSLWARREALPSNSEEQRTWGFGIAHHVLLYAHRTSSRQGALHLKLRAVAPRANAWSEAGMDPGLVGALEQLSADDRELILLVACDGLSLVEAAIVLDLTPEAARKRYSRLRQKLREQLSD